MERDSISTGEDIIILDGGMGHQLARQKIQFHGIREQESAHFNTQKNFMHANIDIPDQVLLAHRIYVEAGAQVITTNTFQCIPGGILDCDDEYMCKIIEAGGQLAVDVKNEFPDRHIKVSGCIPPLGPSFSYYEYDEDQMRVDYELIAKKINPYADYFNCETLWSIRDARISCEVCSQYDKPIWLSLNVDNENPSKLAGGESIRDVVEAVKEIPNMMAILINCVQPETITQSLRELKELLSDTEIISGGYGNGLDKTKPAGMIRHYRKDLTPADYYENYARIWIEECGAKIVGGCCGVFPEHIKYAHDRIRGILKEAQKERTFAIVKVEEKLSLDSRFKEEGLKVAALKNVDLSSMRPSDQDSDWLVDIQQSVDCENICCVVLEGDNAVELLQKIRDSVKADEGNGQTSLNFLHVSSDVMTAKEDMTIFFEPLELLS